MMSYTEEETVETRVKRSVDGEETYSGVNCWVLSYTMTMEEQGITMRTEVTWWMAKSDLHTVHGRIRTYVNNNLISESEFDPGQAPEQAGEPPEPVNVKYAVGYETVSVPAGTFVNCIKVGMEITVEGKQGVSYVWTHSDVPIFGIVKSEMYVGGELLMKMELISYGG
jgi:hypothetical protein